MSTQQSAAPEPNRPAIAPVGELRAFPHALPAPLMPFVGRVEELRRATATLLDPATRLLTITGPGGVGKTRLSLAIARSLPAHFPHGAAFVPLADIRERGLVLPAIARALEIPPDERATPLDVLVSAIGSLRVLLVLDNLEQVSDVAAELADLLQRCPGLAILATSRTTLNMRGEHELSLNPLALPGPHADLDAVAGADAVAFFLQVARGHVPDFELTTENMGLVVEICRRLDGLPLALELAASQLRMFAPATLLRLLERRLDVLTAGPRDLPDRQRTLRDTIRWSYDLLDPDDRAHFRQLATFAGGFTLDASSEVLRIPEVTAMGVIRRLVDHHLVRPIPAIEGRFRMLDTIRAFGLEALDESGERGALQSAHAAWCRDLAASASAALTGTDQGAWLDRLDAELDNLRAAMTWGIEHEPGAALQITSAPWRFWVARGRVREGREWIRHALAAGSDTPSAGRAAGLYAAAELAESLKELPEAIDLYARSQEMYAAAGDDAGVARCLNGRGIVARTQGQLAEAERLHQEALERLGPEGDRRETAVTFNALGAVAYYRGDSAGAERAWERALGVAKEIGDTRAVGMVSGNLGAVALQRGDAARAAAMHEGALQVAQEMRDPSAIARSWINLGSALTEAGEMDRARGHLEAGLHLARDIEETGVESVALYTLGRIALLSGDHVSAASWFGESLELMARTGQVLGMATALESIGCVASALARHEDAMRLFVVAGLLRERTGAVEESDDPLLRKAITTSRQALGVGHARALEDEVGGQDADDVVADTRRIAARVAAAAASTAPPEPDSPGRQLIRQYGLTRREIEILGYVVDRRSDKEIGDLLFISPRTVGTHVTAIRNKMGVTTRREAARIADEMGLGEESDAPPP